MSVLTCRGLRVRRGSGDVLQDVSVALEPGITALLGPNAAGKSTLLKTWAGLYPPAEGHVVVGEVALQDAPDTFRRVVGYLPQFPGVYRGLRVAEHVARHAAWTTPGALRAVAPLLERFGLTAKARWPADRLDAADRRRLWLALLWARGCRVLLLDEPTAGLDLERRIAFWDDILSLRRDDNGPEAVVVTTHLLSEVETYATRAIVLSGGRVAFSGTVQELVETARERAVTWEGPTPRDVVEVGVDPETGYQWGVVVGESAPSGLERRTPSLLDGYMVVVAAQGGQSHDRKRGGGAGTAARA
jgi:ABC-2 type transport system ATP-binding protein